MREYIQVKDPDSWVWPSDWPNIEECPDNEILMIVKEHTVWGFTCKIGDGTGTFSVDWGDGIIQHGLIGNGTTVFKHGSTENGTLTNDGYLIWVVRVYNATENITRWNPVKVSIDSSNSFPLIAVNIGALYIEDLSNCFDPAMTLVVGTNISFGSSRADGANDLSYFKIKSLQVCISMRLTFSQCVNLKKVILPDNWGSVTNCEGLFNSCKALKVVNLPNSWGSVTSISAMFYACNSIEEILLPQSWGNVLLLKGLFYNCNKLKKITLPTSWGVVTNIDLIFCYCYALRKITLPTSWGNVTSMMKAFYFCVSLNAINLPVSWDAVTNVESLFAQSYSLKTIILPAQFGNITKAGSVVAYIAWKNVQNLEFVGSLTEQCDFSYFTTCFNFPILINSLVSKFSLYATVSETSDVTSVRLTNQGSLFNGANPVIGVAYSALSKDSLETLFGDIPSGLISKTIAITGCTGTDAFISKTASGTTINSTTITMANTSSLVAGMEVYGTGISTAKAVTFTDTGDLVNRTAHGLSNGMKISFSSITSTTGIVVNTPYYVINASANTFQVSLTLGGSAIALTTNGSGNLIAIPTIVTINENVSIVIDVPCSATASVTLTAGILKRSIALLKGWTITN